MPVLKKKKKTKQKRCRMVRRSERLKRAKRAFSEILREDEVDELVQDESMHDDDDSESCRVKVMYA